MATNSPTKEAVIFVSIDKLRPDTRGHNLKVKVLETTNLPVRPGRTARMSESLVGDETATILLTARNEQVDLCKPGAHLIIQNSRIDMFRTTMRLAVDSSGKIEQAAGLNITPNVDNNMSNIEFELVQVPAEATTSSTTEPQPHSPTANGETE